MDLRSVVLGRLEEIKPDFHRCMIGHDNKTWIQKSRRAASTDKAG